MRLRACAEMLSRLVARTAVAVGGYSDRCPPVTSNTAPVVKLDFGDSR